jgi:hypothetical protein
MQALMQKCISYRKSKRRGRALRSRKYIPEIRTRPDSPAESTDTLPEKP